MNTIKRTAIIISASSDIGAAICSRWKSNSWDVYGTYRTESLATKALDAKGIKLVYCDLADINSIRDGCSQLRTICPQWDVLVMCPGMMQPIGAFSDGDFNEWEKSVNINFSSQLRIIHELLPVRRTKSMIEPIVLLFAGGGTNSAPKNYSAYTISKIALIKTAELLDAEIPEVRFTILGPGWVKTKIHEATLKAGARAGESFRITEDKIAADDFTPMETVLDCCDWAVNAPREIVSGRNFSAANDKWGTVQLAQQLAADSDMYKLRRNGNDWR